MKKLNYLEKELIEESYKWNGSIEIVKKLIKENVNLVCLDKEDNTPLHNASRGNIELVQFLLKYKVVKNVINHQNKHGWTPLYIASLGDAASELITLLIKKGANPNIPNKDGFTPLHQASMSSIMPIVKTLITQNADLTLKDKKGKIFLDYIQPHRLDEVQKVMDKHLIQKEKEQLENIIVNKVPHKTIKV